MIKKSEYLAKYLDIEFENKKSSFEEYVDDIINELGEDAGLLKKVVGFIIRFKIIKILLNNSLLENAEILKDEEPLSNVIPKRNWLYMFSLIKNEGGLSAPKLLLPKWKFILMIVLILAPVIAILVLLFFQVEFILLLWGILNVGSILVVIFSLYVLVYLLIPGFFTPTELPSLNTFSDLIGTLLIFNLHSFIENDYAEVRKELNDDELWKVVNEPN